MNSNSELLISIPNEFSFAGIFAIFFSKEYVEQEHVSYYSPVRIGKHVSTYTVDEAEYLGAVRHHQYMGDQKYRKECAVRVGVEATVSELTRAHGMRKSRHRERSRTKLQFTFAAIACNVKRFIRHGEKYAYLEPRFT